MIRCAVVFWLAVATGLAYDASAAAREALDGRSVLVECEDDHVTTEAAGPDSVLPTIDASQQDWMRLRVSLRKRSSESEAFDVVLREFAQESRDFEGQQHERWPPQTATAAAGATVAIARWHAPLGDWQVSPRESVAGLIPDPITAEFLQRILGTLVARQPDWDGGRASVTVQRAGRWRQVGERSLDASIAQVWSRQPARAGGTVPLGWHGEITILDPAAGGAVVGRGTASEFGAIDPVSGLYQDLTQTWNVQFTVAGGRYAWRHQCTTRVVEGAPGAALAR